MPLALLASCDSYLDVKSEFDIDSNEIFSNIDGVEMAVNGVYRLMASPDLYSRNLTWGFASAIGQNYTYGASSSKYDINHDWKNFTTMPAAIWEKGFNVIANANQVLAEVEGKDASFFPEGQVHKDMIVGEMYGVRALMHFDLMRLFTPAFTTADNKKKVLMPYVDTYPCPYPTHIASDKLLDRAIADMKIACEKLGYADTLVCRQWNTNKNYRWKTNSMSGKPPRLFFYWRGSHMNFMAANALLARMYMWKGDYTNARKYAVAVVNGFNGIRYSWASSSSLSSKGSFLPNRPDEMIMGIHRNLEDHYVQYEGYSGAEYTNNYLKMDDKVMDALFAGDESDLRYKGQLWKGGEYYAYKRYGTWARKMNDNGYAYELQYFEPVFPIISKPELYFIIAECDIRNGNIEHAMTLINEIRKTRGIMGEELPLAVTADEAMKHLRKEVVKEGLTMGQTFYWFKRQGLDIWYGPEAEIKMTEERWTIPVPDSETI